tara:strand:+ start:98 stop:457 length:360 start_codon:yes stop_codon:yes gene_type:complete
MINTKSVNWSEVSGESKREQWRLYHLFNTFNSEFFNESFNSQDSCVEVATDEGHQWVYTWNDPFKAPSTAENGILKFPVFLNEHYSEDWYSMDEMDFSDLDKDNYIENGELIRPNSDSN